MSTWKSEAATLAMLRSPKLGAEQANDLADDLYQQCGEEWSPARAVGWFFALMPKGWPAPSNEALDSHVLLRMASSENTTDQQHLGR